MIRIPVVFCFDRRILTGAGVSILSLIKSAKPDTKYSIHILHDDLDADIRAALMSLIKDTRHEMTFHEVARQRFFNAPKSNKSWTEIVYFRLLISEILLNDSRAIYSDVDVFFRNDLQKVFGVPMNSCEWAGVVAEKNAPPTIMHKHFPTNTKEHIYFSGFMVMDLDRMRSNDAVTRYMADIEKHGSELRFFDLDLLNISTPSIAPVPLGYVMLEDIYESSDITNTIDFSYLKSVYSTDDILSERIDPAIIHFAGPRGKPWQRLDVPSYYNDIANLLPARLRKGTARDFRKRNFSSKGRATLNMRSQKVRVNPFGKG